MTQYRAEFFTRKFDFIALSLVLDKTLNFDYLTLDTSNIVTRPLNIEKGNFCHVVDEFNNTIFDGIVGEIDQQDGKTSVRISPLLALLDTTIQYDRVLLQGKIEGFIADTIKREYSTNADILQNIPLETRIYSATDTSLDIRSNIHAFWDICSRALTSYGVGITAKLDLVGKKIIFEISRPLETKTVEADLPNCLEKFVKLGDSYSGINKKTYVNKDNESQQVVYYLHNDDTISNINTKRILPVIQAAEYIESAQDFYVEANNRALEQLKPTKYNNLIELLYPINDKIVHPKDLQIGLQTTIYIDKKAHTSILTGWERGEKTCKLIFGMTRADLTKKLTLQRRKDYAFKN